MVKTSKYTPSFLTNPCDTKDDQKSTQRSSKRRTLLKALAGAGIGTSGLVSVTGAASASQYDWEVDENGGKDFQTIQAAVNKATAGDTIKVWEGEYREQVTLYGWHEGDDLTIIGDPGESDTVGPGANAPKLIGDIGESKTAAGFGLGKRSGVTIRGFEISNFHQNMWGVGIKGGKKDIEITDNYIHSVSANGISRPGPGKVNPSGFTVKRNQVEDCGNVAIRLDNVSDSVVRNNLVVGTSSPTAQNKWDENNATDIGIFIHNNVGAPNSDEDKYSVDNAGVLVEGNDLSGEFAKNALYVLTINRNKTSKPEQTKAILRDVVLRENKLDIQGGWGAITLIVNAVYDETTELRDVTITGNDVTSDTSGVLVIDDDTHDGLKGVQLTTNELSANNQGVVVGDTVEGAEVDLFQNNIVDNSEYGLYHQGKGVVNAERNYWGSPTGPTRENPAGKLIGKGDRVKGQVDVKPWSSKEV